MSALGQVLSNHTEQNLFSPSLKEKSALLIAGLKKVLHFVKSIIYGVLASIGLILAGGVLIGTSPFIGYFVYKNWPALKERIAQAMDALNHTKEIASVANEALGALAPTK